LIDKLSSTLKADLIDNEFDDIKDEILEDLEEEAIQAESVDHRRSSNSSLSKASDHRINGHERDVAAGASAAANGSGGAAHRHGGQDADDELIVFKKLKDPSKKGENVQIPNLGATNHMTNRINSLEQ
jgi:hypothetical protein